MMFSRASSSFLCFLSYSFLSIVFLPSLHAQQVYVNKTQFDCYGNHSNTLGFLCNGPQTKCNSYLIFRSNSEINSFAEISTLLNASSAEIALINNPSTAEVYQTLPEGREVVVPVPCSCSGKYYQHNSSYTIKSVDTYLIIANDTYQALTTCQALMAQNPYSSINLTIGLSVLVPLMCACPTRKQTQNGVKFLLTYPIAEGDDVPKLAARFGVDEQSILDANEITEDATIFFNTPLLIPFKGEPSWSQIVNPSAPSPSPLPLPPPSPPPPVREGHKKWIFVGVGIGLGFLVLAVISCLLVVSLRRRRRRSCEGLPPASPTQKQQKLTESSVSYEDLSGKKSSTAISENLLDAVQSLTVYKYEDLHKATDGFSENSLIKGSVYRAMINGDQAAVKRMKGDVSNEIKVLKQINHSNVIRLSGFCIHEGNTFLVYEFADNGSLGDWLHGHGHRNDQSWSKSTCSLSWKQRVQIACDVADGLNYLHNYTSPAHVHKNLKSSNILIDDKFRAKIANFGLARSVGDQEDGLHLTRHVFGTQGYMAPEYLEHGLITSKLDVFAFGVVLLELLSGREAVDRTHDQDKGELLLSSAIGPVLEGDDAKEKLRCFMDPSLGSYYPLDLALVTARLASKCVADDMNSRPSMTDVLMTLSASIGWTSSSGSTYESAVLKR